MAWCLLGLTIIPFSVYQVRPDTKYLPSALRAAYAVRPETAPKSLLLAPTCVPSRLEYAPSLVCLKCHCRFASLEERKFETLFQ